MQRDIDSCGCITWRPTLSEDAWEAQIESIWKQCAKKNDERKKCGRKNGETSTDETLRHSFSTLSAFSIILQESLRTEMNGFQFLVGSRDSFFLHNVQTGSGGYPAS